MGHSPKDQPDILHIAGMEYTATPEFGKQLKEVCPNTGLMQAVLIDTDNLPHTILSIIEEKIS